VRHPPPEIHLERIDLSKRQRTLRIPGTIEGLFYRWNASLEHWQETKPILLKGRRTGLNGGKGGGGGGEILHANVPQGL